MNDNMRVYKPDWLEARQRMEDWWAGKKVDRVVANVTAPINIENIPPYISKAPDKYTDPETVFHNLDRTLNHTFYGGEAFPYHFVYFGPMFSFTYFGSTPNFMESTTWYAPCYDNLDELIANYDKMHDNHWWHMYNDMHARSAERSNGAYLVTMGGITSVIDVIAGLIGNEKTLCAMIEEPEKLIKARDLMLKLGESTFNESQAMCAKANGGGSVDWINVWSPGKAHTNQCDLCVMISPAMFDKFVAEDLDSSYRYVDRGYYHLDGEEEIKHLDTMLKFENLRLIQWVPSTRMNEPSYTDPMNWIDLFKRIQNAGKVAYINTPPGRVKELLTKIDRRLTYLTVHCKDVKEAEAVLREL